MTIGKLVTMAVITLSVLTAISAAGGFRSYRACLANAWRRLTHEH